jgi:hypothetical protein
LPKAIFPKAFALQGKRLMAIDETI